MDSSVVYVKQNDCFLYFMSILLVSFWVVIWAMHICALTNAKLKLNKRSYLSAANKRKTKYIYPQTDPRSLILDNDFTSKKCQDQTCYSYINLPLPGVSIIKPLVGVDRNLSNNLETFFHLDYPNYEILFCIQDPEDPAILIVEELFVKYPQADAKLFIGGSRVGVNPKINNMQPAYEAMKYELILISDSGISMKQDTLLDMVSHMQDDVALVHQMPFVNCHGRDSFQSIFERVYFGTAHARAYLTADLLNINCPTGMSALMRKCLLDEVGGIKAFGQYLAEDFFFAKSFTERGWKICISSQPALQNSANSSDTLSALNSRIQRWIKLRFAMVPQWTLLEPFSECMLLGLLGALSISFLWPISPYAVFAFHLLIWFAFDYTLLCTIQNGPLTCSKTEFLLAWLLRECTALLVFIKALMDPKVTWRSRKFRLKWGGYTEEVSPIPLKATSMATTKPTTEINTTITTTMNLANAAPLMQKSTEHTRRLEMGFGQEAVSVKQGRELESITSQLIETTLDTKENNLFIDQHVKVDLASQIIGHNFVKSRVANPNYDFARKLGDERNPQLPMACEPNTNIANVQSIKQSPSAPSPPQSPSAHWPTTAAVCA